MKNFIFIFFCSLAVFGDFLLRYHFQNPPTDLVSNFLQQCGFINVKFGFFLEILKSFDEKAEGFFHSSFFKSGIVMKKMIDYFRVFEYFYFPPQLLFQQAAQSGNLDLICYLCEHGLNLEAKTQYVFIFSNFFLSF
jgi:hypothetical protein